MPDGPSSWRHRERIKVRYQEVDLQNVVFNAHYLAWCDIACSGWMQAAIGWNGVDDAVDWMLVKVEMASCCDIRLASASAQFGAPIARLGFPMAPKPWADEVLATLAKQAAA